MTLGWYSCKADFNTKSVSVNVNVNGGQSISQSQSETALAKIGFNADKPSTNGLVLSETQNDMPPVTYSH